MSGVKTYVVNGFLEAGKTTYINKYISKDYFYKRGATLIISFEEGEAEFDTEMLQFRNTQVIFYESGTDLTDFCRNALETYRPDRVYLETNAMNEELWGALPELSADLFEVVFTVTLISGETLAPYYANLRSLLQRMLSGSDMVIFNRCEKEDLNAYETGFRLLNRRCNYLWQSELGYSERAFGVPIPFDLTQEQLAVTEENFTCWYLDGSEHPEHYENKRIVLDCQIDFRENTGERRCIAGRSVMTCCMADISFLGFELICPENAELTSRCWVHLEAAAAVAEDRFHTKSLQLFPHELKIIPPAGVPVIGAPQ